MYNWQRDDWPNFNFDLTGTESMLYEYERRLGQTMGIAESLSPDVRIEQILKMMVQEAIKTSEIEGVYLSRKDVMSSMRINLGLSVDKSVVQNRKAKGISDMLMEVRNTFATPLTIEQLFTWHTLLMSDTKGIEIGRFRTHTEPMQVVSGAIDKEKVHFEAPPSAQVNGEMERFIHWFNESAPGGSAFIPSGPVRAAIAHLYFESIHPFEDGNGRIGRAIADKVLSQHLGRPVLYSLSSAIEAKKEAYYKALESAQRGNEISAWMIYFVSTILEAQDAATRQIEFTLRKTRFFDQHREVINDRQRKALQRMFEAGPDGFEGGMNARKYISITAASKATATRDLQDLMEKGIFLQREGGGRSTSYDIVLL